jgi:hypothetical protein
MITYDDLSQHALGGIPMTLTLRLWRVSDAGI